MQEIADWLEKLGMSEYAQRFAENRIDFSVLPDLTDRHLKDLGIALGEATLPHALWRIAALYRYCLTAFGWFAACSGAPLQLVALAMRTAITGSSAICILLSCGYRERRSACAWSCSLPSIRISA